MVKFVAFLPPQRIQISPPPPPHKLRHTRLTQKCQKDKMRNGILVRILALCTFASSLLSSCLSLTTTTSNNNNNIAVPKMSLSSSGASSSSSRFVFGKDDALFGSIEKQQGDQPFGMVLDAGTGLHSLRWLATLRSKGLERCVAITADKVMQRNCEREVEALNAMDYIEVVIGNWFENNNNNKMNSRSSSSDSFNFQEGVFDVILADYLIGAMDGFSPYTQDLIVPKLAKLLRPGGRLYIVGLQPIPDQVNVNNNNNNGNKDDDEDDDTNNVTGANIICKVRQVRDACILLAGHHCYREYPVDWVQRQVQQQQVQEEEEGQQQQGRHWNLKLIRTTRMPILYRYETILRQINVGRSKLSLFSSSELATSMATVLDDLDHKAKEATKNGRIRLGFDYIVCAEKVTNSS